MKRNQCEDCNHPIRDPFKKFDLLEMIKHCCVKNFITTLATELKAELNNCKSITFSTSVNSGERFCATTRMRRSFELEANKNIIIDRV